MALAGERGMRLFKLGKLAEVNLRAFSMAGKDWASLRRATNRAERDGLAFEFVPAGQTGPLLPNLRQVSDAWLALNKAGEKRFSLGAFDESYMRAHPLALIRLEGRIIAFVNILEAGDSVFVDLMRFIPGVHRGAMDLLMIRLIERLKADGVARLNLGMAPLSGLSRHRRAPLWERMGSLLYEKGNRHYNFKGLRAFKEKFAPQWKPRYMAVPEGDNPYLAAAATAVLIAGGLRRMFVR